MICVCDAYSIHENLQPYLTDENNKQFIYREASIVSLKRFYNKAKAKPLYFRSYRNEANIQS